MKYNILEQKDHDVKIKLGRTVYYGYSKKKLEKRYPDNKYTVIGEIKRNKDKKKIGELVSGDAVSVPDTYSRVFNRIQGYLCVEQDSYIAVLRLRLLPLLLFLLGLLVGLMLLRMPMEQIVINPDAPIPDISPIEDDKSVKPEVEEGAGSVTMVWTLEAEVDLSERKVNVFFQNPNASTHDIELELYIISGAKELLVARSGRVKAGYAINRMDLLKEIVLSEGVYTGLYRVTGYDPETGEEAAYLPEIPNVVITAK